MRGSIPLSSAKLNNMSDKEALQEIIYMVNDYVNNIKAINENSTLNENGVNAFTNAVNFKLISDLIKILEQIK